MLVCIWLLDCGGLFLGILGCVCLVVALLFGGYCGLFVGLVLVLSVWFWVLEYFGDCVGC